MHTDPSPEPGNLPTRGESLHTHDSSSPMPEARTFRARYVFPVSGPPVAGGTVTIHEGRIAAVGLPGDAATCGQIEDLGNVAILPGLVNAHTHLEFSDVRSPLGRQGMGLVDWIRYVIAHRRQDATPDGEVTSKAPLPSSGDPVAAATAAVELGLSESLADGVTTLGEIAQPGWSTEPFDGAPCDTTVFLELIASKIERVPAAVDLARRHLDSAWRGTSWRPGLSPHAPYSVHPELLRQLVALSVEHHVPLAFHLAESREELELLHTGGGPFKALLEWLDAWDPTAESPGMGLSDYLRMLARADRALVVHGNYLGDEEIALVAEHRDHMAVVYCPRTHAWFGHAAYPLERMLAAGVTVALGTDSRASSPDLSVLAEMRWIAAHYPSVRPETIVELGTLRGATALGCQREVGTLEPGKRANLAVVSLPEYDEGDPYELLLGGDGRVLGTCYRGMMLKPPNPSCL